ncbi:MAG: PP2C family protein-serine/threonine phosphatase [Kineosporiaceae bacterium]
MGGDFFDFVADAGRVRVILGDVSGKGVDAVTQAARAIRAFRQYAAGEPDLLGVTRRIDAYVSPFWKWEYYATAVLVELGEADTLTVVSAGHPPPFHVSGGTVRELAVRPCLPLGLGAGDEVSVHVWDPGDRLLLYTDGLVEARDTSGRFLPVRRSTPPCACRTPTPASTPCSTGFTPMPEGSPTISRCSSWRDHRGPGTQWRPRSRTPTRAWAVRSWACDAP